MDKTAKFWDKTARKYSKQKIKDEEGYKKTLDATKKYLGPDKVVLECGCGTGTTALILAPHCKELIATDISAEMIKIGNEKKQSQQIQNVQFKQATLFDASLQKESYDVLLAYNLIHLLEATDAVMERIHELLRPEGIFISKTACLAEKSWFWPVIAAVVGKVLGIGCIQNFSVEQYKDAMRKAGFDVIEEYVQYPKPPRIFVVAKKV